MRSLKEGSLRVSIEINGKQEYVGTIFGDSYLDAKFQYAPSYLGRTNVRPISISLPLQEEAFSADQTRRYFEGLLPEGFSRRAVANWTKTNEDDYLSILEKLGQESLGAIQIQSDDSVLNASYERLTKEQVKELAAEGATKSTKLLMETHLSLTGASGKVGLYYHESEDAWFLPIGNSASTHIVKQSHIRLNQIVLNEQLCMTTARKLGIDVPKSFIINVGEARDEDVLYATQRFDRKISEEKVCGLPIPYRLHQEDFAQAMKISSADKYEIEKQGYLKQMFSIIRNYSSNPIEDQLKLWDMIIFNFLIGNTDCHLKNYSLLYNQDLSQVRLAPAYDIVCTRAYPGTRDMSYFIGSEINIEQIKRTTFKCAADEIGIGSRLAMQHFDSLADSFEQALVEAIEEVEINGFKDASAFGKQIRDNCGFAGLA